jgi:hypothetical protein
MNNFLAWRVTDLPPQPTCSVRKCERCDHDVVIEPPAIPWISQHAAHIVCTTCVPAAPANKRISCVPGALDYTERTMGRAQRRKMQRYLHRHNAHTN